MEGTLPLFIIHLIRLESFTKRVQWLETFKIFVIDLDGMPIPVFNLIT